MKTSPHSRPWIRATLGYAAAVGSPINVWCNNATCGYRLEHGRPYQAVLTGADLVSYAERYGDAVTFEDFRKRLRCRHCGGGDVSTIVDAHHETPEERWEREGREKERDVNPDGARRGGRSGLPSLGEGRGVVLGTYRASVIVADGETVINLEWQT